MINVDASASNISSSVNKYNDSLGRNCVVLLTIISLNGRTKTSNGKTLNDAGTEGRIEPNNVIYDCCLPNELPKQHSGANSICIIAKTHVHLDN